MKRIVILGSNGQLGVDLCRRMNSCKNLEVLGLTRQDIDLTRLQLIEPIVNDIDFDILINATGYHKTDEVEANAQLATTINAVVPAKLADICRFKQALLIHLSTDYVFGGQSKRSPLHEEDSPAPLNVYGSSKLMGESLCSASEARTMILRVSSLFGVAGASGKGGNFVETMLRLAKEKGHLKVVNDQIMAPTSTADIAEAVVRLISTEAPLGLYHVCGTGQASWYEFAREIVSQAGLVNVKVEPVPTSEMPTPAKRAPYSVLSNGKLAQVVGWSMPDWRDALNRYLTIKSHK